MSSKDEKPGAPESTGSVSSAFLARLATRTRLRRWSRTKAVIVALGVVSLVVLLVWVVTASSLFSVRKVEVDGASGLLAERVAARAENQKGTPLAQVDLGAVKRAVETVPGAADVVVTRGWPSTLRIAVTPRRAAATVKIDGTYAIVDLEGVQLAKTDERPDKVPLVTIGEGPGADLSDGLAVLRDAPPAVRERVEKVVVRSGEDVRLDLDKGVTVHWGSAADGARKAEVLVALLGQKAKVYDVSAPDLPTTRS